MFEIKRFKLQLQYFRLKVKIFFKKTYIRKILLFLLIWWCKDCPIDFKFSMIIPERVRYNIKIVATPYLII